MHCSLVDIGVCELQMPLFITVSEATKNHESRIRKSHRKSQNQDHCCNPVGRGNGFGALALRTALE